MLRPASRTAVAAGQRNVAIDLKPVRFVLRLERAHGLAYSIFEPRLRFEGRVDFEESVVERTVLGIEQHLDNAEALVNGIE